MVDDEGVGVGKVGGDTEGTEGEWGAEEDEEIEAEKFIDVVEFGFANREIVQAAEDKVHEFEGEESGDDVSDYYHGFAGSFFVPPNLELFVFGQHTEINKERNKVDDVQHSEHSDDNNDHSVNKIDRKIVKY